MTNSKGEGDVVPPWYKHFWPWFLISLPLIAVVGGLFMLSVALNTSDTLVKDDWYKEGKAINRMLREDERAKTLGLEIQLSFDEVIGELRAHFVDPAPTDLPEELRLEIIHPTLESKDQIVSLKLKQPLAHYVGNVETSLVGKYHLIIADQHERWRIKKEVQFPTAGEIVFEP